MLNNIDILYETIITETLFILDNIPMLISIIKKRIYIYVKG